MVLLWAKLLQSSRLDPRTTAQALAALEQNARAMAQIITDLVDLGRAAAGTVALDLQPVDLQSLIDGVVQSLRPRAEAEGISLSLRGDPAMGAVIGDPDRLRRLAAHLVAHGLKFAPEDGRGQVQLRRVGDHVRITVTDTHLGLSPEVLAHGFEPQRQAGLGATRADGASALPLAIVRHLAELHGGTASAESGGAGQGVTLSVALPLTGPAAPAALEGDRPSGAGRFGASPRAA